MSKGWKGGGSSRLRMKLRASPTEELDEDNEEEKWKSERGKKNEDASIRWGFLVRGTLEGGRGDQWKGMRESWSLRRRWGRKGEDASNAEYKAAAEELSGERREEWKRDEKVERVHREPRTPSQRPDLLLSIQTACDLPPWIICKYIYFDFVHNMILFCRLAYCTLFFLHSNLLWKKERMST